MNVIALLPVHADGTLSTGWFVTLIFSPVTLLAEPSGKLDETTAPVALTGFLLILTRKKKQQRNTLRRIFFVSFKKEIARGGGGKRRSFNRLFLFYCVVSLQIETRNL